MKHDSSPDLSVINHPSPIAHQKTSPHESMVDLLLGLAVCHSIIKHNNWSKDAALSDLKSNFGNGDHFQMIGSG